MTSQQVTSTIRAGSPFDLFLQRCTLSLRQVANSIQPNETSFARARGRLDYDILEFLSYAIMDDNVLSRIPQDVPARDIKAYILDTAFGHISRLLVVEREIDRINKRWDVYCDRLRNHFHQIPETGYDVIWTIQHLTPYEPKIYPTNRSVNSLGVLLLQLSQGWAEDRADQQGGIVDDHLEGVIRTNLVKVIRPLQQYLSKTDGSWAADSLRQNHFSTYRPPWFCAARNVQDDLSNGIHASFEAQFPGYRANFNRLYYGYRELTRIHDAHERMLCRLTLFIPQLILLGRDN